MATGGAAAAAAAIEAERQRREEEEMTPYSAGDLAEGWEFKILRANTAAFRKPEMFRAILNEEARGGWMLVEKFDDYRVRLKRPAKGKELQGDLAEGYDPYRTTLGASSGKILAIVFGAAFGIVLLIVLGIALMASMTGH